MKHLYSYNQMKTLFGENDEQVKQIRKHLDCINPNKDISAKSHNNSLEAWQRLEK